MLKDNTQKKVSKAYERLYDSDLVEDIMDDLDSQEWAKLIRVWLTADSNERADPEEIADALYEAAQGAGTDEQVFIDVLCNCRPKIYREACDLYEENYEKSIEQVIKKEFSGKAEDAFLAAHFTMYDIDIAVARSIKEAVRGAGSDEDSLIRITVLFCDNIYGEALIEAYDQFGDIVKDIKRDLTGKFEMAIMAMWGLE